MNGTQTIAAVARVDAERGDADAQCYLAINYTYGWEGFEQNERSALHWFRLAAAQGHPDALYNLGFLHDVGDGVSQDPVEAQRLYTLAAAQGHVEALNEVRAPRDV